MKRLGQIVFLGTAVAALALYGLTAPDGLPWNASSHLALAYLGEIVRLPAMPHPFWGFHVQVFGGPVALSVSLAALAAGLVGWLVNRYFGWRFAIAAALTWTFLPAVWNRAITGERSVCLAAMAVVAAWTLNAAALWVTRKARSVRKTAQKAGGAQGLGVLPTVTHEGARKIGRVNRVAGWSALGAAGVFALASLTFHDYRLGEAASVYARGVVEEAGERVIVLNGAADDQVVVEAEKRGGGGQGNRATVSLRNDDAYRTNLVAWVRSSFPSETNLWVAAQVSPQAFVDAAVKRHPERFYLMNGKSTTVKAWERRWEAFKPHLGSRDGFVRVGRRLFAHEGNALGNALADTSGKEAFALYRRIESEIDPGNFSALVNMSELIRRGCAVDGEEKKAAQEKLEAFFRNAGNRRHCREIARQCGPIRTDPELVEKMGEEVRKRLAERIAAGEKVEYSPEVLSLVEWSNEMVRLMDANEIVRAGRIARAILSNPKWSGFIPANAVMGTVASSEGDYVASERFFQAATCTTNRVATTVLNDYADTLAHLGKLDEAEATARRAVAQADERSWLPRLTLAEVLEKRAGDRAEIRSLLKSVLGHAPQSVREKVRAEHKEFLR